MEYPPRPTIYINNLNEKIKKEGNNCLLKNVKIWCALFGNL